MAQEKDTWSWALSNWRHLDSPSSLCGTKCSITSEKSTSEYLQCQSQRAQGKCCGEPGCGILGGNGFWKQLHERQKTNTETFIQLFADVEGIASVPTTTDSFFYLI